MSLTPAIGFLDRFPEFSEISESRIQLFLDDAVLEVSQSFFGQYYNKALCLYTAHVLALANVTTGQTGGALGNIAPVASRTIGDTSVTFANSGQGGPKTSQWLESTPYGQELARLYKLFGAGGLTV